MQHTPDEKHAAFRTVAVPQGSYMAPASHLALLAQADGMLVQPCHVPYITLQALRRPQPHQHLHGACFPGAFSQRHTEGCACEQVATGFP